MFAQNRCVLFKLNKIQNRVPFFFVALFFHNFCIRFLQNDEKHGLTIFKSLIHTEKSDIESRKVISFVV